MAVPKRKTTPSKRNMRRANHDKVTPVQLVSCANCGATIRAADESCYRCGTHATLATASA